ncbi:MAG: FlgD immunoglobulin-like domain containing protein [candidate division WOR-3 bacterium]
MARVLADDVQLNYNGTNPYVDFIKANVYDAGGNNNNRLDPGETANITALLKNIGGTNFTNLTTTLLSSDPYITIIDNTGYFGALAIDSTKENLSDPYIVSVSASCPEGHNVNFDLIATEGNYCDTFSFSLVVGRYHYLVWNPDPTPTPGQTIHNTLSTLGYSGTITTNLLAEPDLNMYRSIFICCGVYPNNYRIPANGAEATVITNYLNNGGCVYLEGGEVWYYDPQVGGHNFGPLFGIQGISDGSADMGPVVGVNNTFTFGMNFNYAGENNYMDRINATTGFVIFIDGDNNYNCGVARNAGNYRTVGTSFELGGLVDGAAPSTKRVLLDSIMHFFGIFQTGIEEENSRYQTKVEELLLSPNLFNNKLFIKTRLAEIKIYDMSGKLIKTLTNHSKNSEKYLIWDGTNDQGLKMPAGVYFISAKFGDKNIAKRVVLLK